MIPLRLVHTCRCVQALLDGVRFISVVSHLLHKRLIPSFHQISRISVLLHSCPLPTDEPDREPVLLCRFPSQGGSIRSLLPGLRHQNATTINHSLASLGFELDEMRDSVEVLGRRSAKVIPITVPANLSDIMETGNPMESLVVPTGFEPVSSA